MNLLSMRVDVPSGSMTERDSDAEKRAVLQAEISQAARLTEMDKVGSAFAHELNQPLAAIVNYLQACHRLLQDQPTPVTLRVRQALEKAVGQADRASQIIRNLRDLIHKPEAERRLEDIGAIVLDAVTLTHAEADAAGVALHLTGGVGLPRVYIAKLDMHVVLLHLIRNGIEAMAQSPQRDLTIETARTADGSAQVRIIDRGAGLPAEVTERLFQPFVTTKPTGLGAGLSICRTIVEAHGGRIEATPNPDGGTIFSFTIPSAE